MQTHGEARVPFVLVADGDDARARSIRQALAGDHRIECVDHGEQAVERALALRPDLLLCDDGLRVGDEPLDVVLSRQPELERTSVVLLVRDPEGPALPAQLQTSADDFITTPFDPAELRARVRARLTAGRKRVQLHRRGVAFSVSPNGVLVSDREGNIVDVNQTACSMLGRTREEVLRLRLFDLLSFEPSRFAGNGGFVERHLQRKSGRLLPVELAERELPDGLNMTFVRDVSRRRQREQELASRRAELNRIESVARIGSWRLDVKRAELEWSDETHRIFGTSRSTPVSYEKFLSFVHPDDREEVDRKWQAALLGSPYDLEHRIVVGGEVKWVRAKAELAFDESGVLQAAFGVVQDVTDRHHAEESRLAEQKRLEAIVSISSDGILSVDEKQNIVLWNDGAEQMFGWTREEILGRPLDLLLPVRFREQHREQVREFGSQGPRTRPMSHQRPVPALRKNGEEFLVEAAISAIEVGGRRFYSAVVRDVTERRSAEALLQQSEERLRLAATAAGVGTFDYQLDTGSHHWSRELCEIVGVPPGHAIALDEIPTIAHPDDRKRLREAMQRSQDPRGTGEFVIEHRVLRPDRSTRWLLVRGRTLFDDSNGARRPIRFSGAVVDITAQKAVEQEQQLLAEAGRILVASGPEYAQRLRSISRLATGSFADWCLLDVFESEEHTVRMEVAHADPAQHQLAERLRSLQLDRTRPNLLSTAVETRRPVLMSVIHDEDLLNMVQSQGQLEVLRELKPVSLIAIPLMVRGELLGAMGFIRTGDSGSYRPDEVRTASELALRAAFALHNSRLYERTRRAVVARDQVLRVVAHDLRSPLTSIHLHAQRLGRAADARTRLAAESIERSAQRMRRLIDDLLDVARLDSGKFEIARTRVPGRLLLDEVLATNRPAARASSLELEADLPRELPDVLGDHDRLLQVFDNLLGNAIKFTPSGGRVTVSARQEGDRVLFSVRDTGPGIPAADLPHLFDPYWQASKASRQGAGLGLSIVKGIVRAHGGRVWAESVEGEGSTFTFSVPVASAERRGADAEMEHPSAMLH